MKASYAHLQPGDEGFWPIVAARPDDLRDGDRLVEDREIIGIVSNVRIHGPVVKFEIDGKPMRIGRLARISIDRFGTHAELGTNLR